MSKQLTVNGTTFNYPTNRESPGWGSEATDWAEEVTTVLTNVAGQGDILVSSATINNNVSSATNVTGFSFDPTIVRGAVCEFSIYRSVTGSDRSETGLIFISYKSQSNSFDISQVGGGISGVTLSITSSGQVQYVSDDFAGASYSGTIKFRARAISQ